MRQTTGWALLLGLGATACDPYALVSEQEQVTVRLTGLRTPGLTGLTTGQRVLLGSRTSSEWQIGNGWVARDDDGADCFRVTTVPDVGALGGPLTFDEVGPVEWTFEATPCASLSEGTHLDDRLVIEVVEPDDLSVGRHFEWMTAAELLLAYSGEPTYVLADGRTELPDFLTPTDGRLRVLAGGRTVLQAEVTDPGGRTVAVGEGVGGLELDGIPSERLSAVSVRVEAPDEVGLTGDLSFRSPGLDTDLGRVEIVAQDAVERLEVLVLDQIATNGDRSNFAVMAVPVDGEGRRLFGAPIDWTLLRGASLPLADPELEPNDGPLLVEPTPCLAPSERAGLQTSVLRAEAFGKRARVELSWTLQPPEEAADAAWTLPAECVTASRGGCGCGATPAMQGTWLGVFGLLGALSRRRRHV
ncbi:MAG: hypothetical protein AAF211_01730 [Myxococcota bacterium]